MEINSVYNNKLNIFYNNY